MEEFENKVLGFDIDGSLCRETCWTPQECRNATPRFDKIDKLVKAHRKNFIIINTARRYDLAEETLLWLDRYNIPYHAISFKKTALDWLYDDRVTNIEDL